MPLKKLIKIVAIFAVVVLVWVHFTRYMDWKNRCYIKIVPSYLELSNSNIKKAIGVIKEALPSDYADLCRYAEVIDPSPSCGGFGGGCFYSWEEKKIYITTSQSDLAGTIGVIVHEVCHAKQKAENRSLDENECYAEDDRVFKTISVF